ncbi:AMP-binding protein [Nonomuraea sp. NPDC050643]|uniref:AMP-binding protein n=1 Tax=Nonomuraea sp. NPDC050643 TaxID=3155660 RepID=UPI00340D92B4
MTAGVNVPPAPHKGVPRLEDRVRQTAARFPTREALRVGPRRVTYAELLEVAEAWAAVLGSARNQDGPATVCLLAGRTFTGYVGILATLCAGATVTPMAPEAPPNRLSAMLQDTKPDVLIVDQAGAAALAALAEHCALPPVFAPMVAPEALNGTGISLLSVEDDRRGRPSSTADIAYVLHTSGSTGRPKGVPITHANMHAFLTAVHARYDFTEKDVFSQLYDLTFDLSFFDLFIPWSCGGTVVCTPPAVFAHMPEFVAKEGLTVWFSVPSAISAIHRMGGLRPGSFPSLRLSLFGGEALTLNDAVAWQQAAANSSVENIYGPTELTIVCATHRLSPEDEAIAANGIVPIGTLFPGLEGMLLDEEGRPHPQEGELCVTGPQMFSGYVNSADDEGRFVRLDGRRWYRTGDLVRSAGDDRLLFIGRMDQQIKIRGYRVELPEIEYWLRMIPGVDAAAVLLVGEGTEQRLMAFYTGVGMDSGRMKAKLHEHLPAYMVPHEYRLVEQFPINERGKTDRRALMATVSAPISAGGA